MAHAECSTELRQRPFWIPAFGENDAIDRNAKPAMTNNTYKTKTEASSRIFDAVHETATDLRDAGFIDAHRMRSYDELCLNTNTKQEPAIPKVLSDAAIKEFLETVPLYSWREFGRRQIPQDSLAISEIDSYCEKCDQPRPFQVLRPRGSGMGLTSAPALSTGTSYLHFTCVSCRKTHREFLLEQVVSDTTIKLQKFGELPRKALPRNAALQKFLADDLTNYERAVACLANDYGIAAFAYFRRITENNIVRLLDLIQEDVAASNAEPIVVEALAALRVDSPMSERIRVANLALPAHLKPDGLNPLGKLYQ